MPLFRAILRWTLEEDGQIITRETVTSKELPTREQAEREMEIALKRLRQHPSQPEVNLVSLVEVEDTIDI